MDMMLPTFGVMVTGENVYDAGYWWSDADREKWIFCCLLVE
jgi:hypothetical protein